MSQLSDVQGLLAAARVLLEQAYTMTTACAAPAVAAEPDYAELYCQANEAFDSADKMLDDTKRERERSRIVPRLVVDCGRPDWVYVCGQPVRLRPAEFRLLATLCRSPRRAVRYPAIYEAMWSNETFVEPAQIAAQVSRLRRKLASCWPPELPELIATIPRVGAVLQVPAGMLAFAEMEEEVGNDSALADDQDDAASA